MAKLRSDAQSGLMLPPGFMAVLAVVMEPINDDAVTEWVPVAAHAIVAFPNAEKVGQLLLYLQDVDEPFLIVGDKLTIARQIADALFPDDGTL